ncbi:MAG TPA: hydroxysqualene dehydroxylase HpnE [Candidatus Limnocylindrales bacterium]|nr:hydroxysqualene dehydroxylase HpnE [Candidatus Limnocylindrales bacterium]
MMPVSQQKTVCVVGGGLAGLAAGCALADAGLKVTLFERRPYVGGRASSYEHPGTGEIVDNCQHILLGCCTNLVHFYEKLGVAGQILWFDEITFIEPGGRMSRFVPKSYLPAPMHNLPSFLGAAMLGAKDKLSIARALSAMSREVPGDSSEDFLSWLKRHQQTEQSIRRFWEPVLFSALNEDLDRMSVRYAAKVFRESFMNSAQGGRMGIPGVPLSELYSAAAEYIRARGGEVRLRAPVSVVDPQAAGVTVASGAGEERFDFAVLAVPFQSTASLLPSEPEAQAIREKLEHFQSSPITGIHLWFDREITPLSHAALLDRTIQWLFHKSKFQKNREGAGSYVELVVSSSKTLVPKSREEILELGLRELAEFFPAVNEAKVLKAAVVKEIYATYSILPGLDQYRPASATPWPRLFLAGDWTATGWPATMEGAVRSGYMAAEGLTASLGQAQRFVVADLPPQGLMRLL